MASSAARELAIGRAMPELGRVEPVEDVAHQLVAERLDLLEHLAPGRR